MITDPHQPPGASTAPQVASSPSGGTPVPPGAPVPAVRADNPSGGQAAGATQRELVQAHRDELDALQRLTATITEASATITEATRERSAIAWRLTQAGLHLRTVARPMGVAEATAGRIAARGKPRA